MIRARRLENDPRWYIAAQPFGKRSKSGGSIGKTRYFSITQSMDVQKIFRNIYANAIINFHRHVLCLSCKLVGLRIRSGLMRRRRLIKLKNGPARPSPKRSSRRQFLPKVI